MRCAKMDERPETTRNQSISFKTKLKKRKKTSLWAILFTLKGPNQKTIGVDFWSKPLRLRLKEETTCGHSRLYRTRRSEN